MITPALPLNENERLKALRSYNLLDTLPEEDFDNITYLASFICQTPISLISLVDKDRQFFKSHLGLSATETSIDLSFCAHAINQPQTIFEVEDARLDNRFYDNDLVTSNPNIVFYAGIPLVTIDGFALGTLCVIDEKPRILTPEQKEALTRLSKQVMFLIEARQKKIIEEELKLIDFTFSNSAMPTFLVKEDSSFYKINEAATRNLGYSKDELKDKKIIELDDNFDKNKWALHWAEIKAKGSITIETTLKKKDGTIANLIIYANYLKHGDLELLCSYATDITEKKKQEEALKLSAFTIDNAEWGLVYFRADGTIYNCNLAFSKMYGYTSLEEVKTKTVFDFGTAYTTETWKQYWDIVKKTKGLKFIAKRIKKDGTLIDVEINPNILQFGDLELNCAYVYEVTDKLKAEDDLKQSNQRYEYATLATSDVIWEANLLKNEIYISKNFTTFFGHPVADNWMPIENNIWRQNIHPDQVEEVIKNQYEILYNPSKKNWQGEYKLKRADGSYAIVIDKTFAIKDDRGNVIRMVGAMQDITKHKEEEERLRLMESVILNTNDAILITEAEQINEPGPVIVFVNDAFCKITGYSKEEVIGKNPRMLQCEETDKNELDKFREKLVKWEHAEMTIINKKKSGDKFWVNVVATPLTNENGKFTHWIGVQRDVTIEIENAREKEKLLKELVENNLELKQFSYITSHNLRAPLTNLVSICDIIEPETGTDALTLQLIDAFKTSTHHLNETLNDLIEVLIIKENRNIRKDQLTFEEIFKKITESLSTSLLDQKVIINADFSAAPAVIFVNEYLESVFLNLLTNSVKYRHPNRDPIITIKTSKEPNGDTKLTFADNGIGIDMAAAKDKIFGLYKRFHNNADSKGIGLYLIHSQITTLGGKIEVESEVNIGTTFTITFK